MDRKHSIKSRNSGSKQQPQSRSSRKVSFKDQLKGTPSIAAPTSPNSSKLPANSNTLSTSSLEYRHLPATISDALFDVVCLLINCRRHEQVLLTRGTKRFLPCVPLTDKSTWEDTAIKAAKKFVLFGRDEDEEDFRNGPFIFASIKLVHILRVQLPQSERFITRLVFLMTLNNEEISSCCTAALPSESPVRWYPLREAVSGRLENLWGPEVEYFARLISAEDDGMSIGEESIQEYSLADAFIYKMLPQEGEEREGAAFRELMVQYSISDVERTYADYLEHAFPSFFLSRTSFLFYLARHNILKGEQLTSVGHRLFRAFRRRGGSGQQYLSFTELLLGLAAIDKRTKNGRARLAMVFLSYDVNRDGVLSVGEFRVMMEHLQKNLENNSKADVSSDGSSSISSSTTSSPSPRLSNAEVIEEMRRIGGIYHGKEVVLTLEAFLKAVLGPKRLLKGTSQLMRVSASPFAQITRSMATRALLKLSGGAGKAEVAEVLVHKRYEGCCAGCRSKPSFEIAANVVRLNRRGECINWTPLEHQSSAVDFLEQITFPSSASPPSLVSLSSSSSHSSFPSLSHLHSVSEANRWLHNLHAKIRYHNNEAKGTCEAPFGLYHGGRGEAFLRFYTVVKRVVREVSAILETEDRVLKVAEPVFVIGDIHGNLEDLLSIERSILRSSPHLTTNYLFLGDYVDRGKWGFECFLYLVVAKLLNRNRIFLIRGNHECRPIQEKYRFKEELILKYGRHYGLKFWDLVNYVCDRMPVCAVVGGAIFCAHGGIPFSVTDLGQINRETPHVLPEPDRTAPWVWQMLWNDPMDWGRFLESAQLQKVMPSATNYTDMYLFNVKRGTAYIFNDYAVAAFLHTNRLQFIIRAHEVPEEFGVRFNFGRLCTTIFSCSHYTNRPNNECSVILVGGEGRIRVLRIDTRLNKPAMM